jgi:outer membrane protein assembly complex protein YaeT
MVRLTLAHYVCAISLLAVSPAELSGQSVEQAQKYEGKAILTIQFDPKEQPLNAAELHDILPLKQDEPLRMADVRASIERLFATGRYADIQVDAEPYAMGTKDGVIVRFVTKNSWFIGSVTAAGRLDEPPRAGQLENASGLDLGQPFNQLKVQDAATAQKRLMESNGLFGSQITPSFTYDNNYQQINIHFDVTSGPRARFATPVLLGDLKLPPQLIVRATKFRRWIIKTWKPMTQTRVSQALESVRALYQRENRLEARVSLESMKYDPQANTATPTLQIDAGPRILVNTIGAKISKGQLQHYVPIFEEHSVDDDLLLEGQHNLRDYLQSQGYFEAEVAYKPQRVENDQATIDYIVNTGPRHKLAALEIRGNKYFSTESIRERMYLQTASFLQFPHGRYSESLLRRDRDAIVNLYQSNGFLAVKVNSRTQDNYRGKPGELAVFLEIQEGPQSFVSSLEVDGIEHLDRAQVLRLLSSIKGQPFSQFSVAVDRDTILAQYFDKGFANATFEWNSQPAEEPNRVNLHYIIHEGTQQFVRQVLVSDLKNTRPDLVNRRLQLNPGDPLSPTALTETQRKLYDLGVFARVDEAIQDPDGDTADKYVLYQLDEARLYSLAFGLGAELGRIGGCNNCLDAATGASGFYPRISVDVARSNLFGLAHSISLRTQFSTLEQRALLNYTWPHFEDNDKLTLAFTGLFDHSKDIRTYNYTRLEGAVQLSQRLTRATTLLYRLAYRRVSVSDLKVTPFLVSQLSQPDRVGIASINLIQDRRDDPMDPHHGVYNTVDFGVAEHILGSQRDFTRVLIRNASYYPIGKKLVLARSTEIGNISAFHYSGDPTNAIALPERFFGGGDSHRGFPEYQAGPRDDLTGFPLGGNALFFNQTELRFPLIGDTIGGVLFHDMGNIYSSFDHFSLRVHQKNLEDFNYMVHAVGFGIRYKTPVGPLRVDLAYSINPPYFNGFNGTLQQLLSAGVTPCPAPAGAPYQCNVQNVSHFQYFFSIGQTF